MSTVSVIKKAKEMVSKAKKQAETQNRKSTDTTANTGGTTWKLANNQKRPAKAEVRSGRTSTARPVYYRKSNAGQTAQHGGLVRKAAENTLKQVNAAAKKRPVRYSKKPSGTVRPGDKVGPTWEDEVKWLANDWEVRRGEEYGPDFRVTSDNVLAKLDRDAQTNKFRHWLNGRVRAYPNDDKGSALEQAKRAVQLYGAIYPTTKGYTPEQARAIQSEARNAPVDLQDLFIRYGDKLSPIVDVVPEGKTAFYSPQSGRVHGIPKDIASGTRHSQPFRTHWHEYGHNLDWLSGSGVGSSHPSYSSAYRRERQGLGDIIANDVDSTLRDYWTNVREETGPYDASAAIRYFSGDVANDSPSGYKYALPLSDMMEPYSLERGGGSYPVGGGHGVKYWKSSPWAVPAEAFANLTSSAVQGGDSLRYVQAVLPNTYDAYLDMLDRMAAGR